MKEQNAHDDAVTGNIANVQTCDAKGGEASETNSWLIGSRVNDSGVSKGGRKEEP